MPTFLLVALLIAFSSTVHAEAWKDVPEEGELHTVIDALTDAGILNPNGSFRPEDSLIRAELAVLLARAMLKPEYVENFRGVSSYQDIATDDWFAPSVEALKQSGTWNTDRQSSTFTPYRPATRAEFLHALFTMKRENTATFMSDEPLALDVQDANAWYYPALSAAVAYGFVTPDAEGMLHPLEPITRREAALWMYASRDGNRKAASSFSSWTLRVLFAQARGMLGSLFVLP